jgi:hypothetical protein
MSIRNISEVSVACLDNAIYTKNDKIIIKKDRLVPLNLLFKARGLRMESLARVLLRVSRATAKTACIILMV